MKQFREFIENIELTDIIKLVFHSPAKNYVYKKVVARPVEIKGDIVMQFEQFTDKQVFHKNVSTDDITDVIVSYLSGGFKKLMFQTKSMDYNIFVVDGDVKITKTKAQKSAEVQSLEHNKMKQYLIPESFIVEPLIDLGIFTKDGKILKAKYDKYKQINRFLELVNDVIKGNPSGKLNIIDFGCGKSSLTFILYYFLKEVCKYDISIVGLDLKQDVIDNCNLIAKKYKYDSLKFIAGDIKDYTPSGEVDMVICLHACDTATDYALYSAIKWGAKSILAVPCCQHEVNSQINTEKFSIFTKHGIVKERISALMTDAVRANLLELNDYEAQILEFVDFSHSPKNLLIRAVKKTTSESQKAKAKKEIDAVLSEYGIFPTLYRLLGYKLN
ncbi:MAG: SAM-dependent methyltransferase [Defluviitaleaceae bacterium]|nr:SAM-dependent methyltransferase [Defluviitaleaceae bacterium]